MELRQYRLDDHLMVKKYYFHRAIRSLVTTWDSKHAFVGLKDGSLHRICLDREKVIKNYGKITDEEIISMAVTRDSNFLIASGFDGCLRKISITSQEVVKDFVGRCNIWIRIIELAPGDETLFVYDSESRLKLIDFRDGTTVHDFATAYRGRSYRSQGMLLTGGGEYLFTRCYGDGLKQWSVRDRALVQDFGKLAGDFFSICD
jgi:hypothetical protein